mgnify:CR=1 FL=1
MQAYTLKTKEHRRRGIIISTLIFFSLALVLVGTNMVSADGTGVLEIENILISTTPLVN